MTAATTRSTGVSQANGDGGSPSFTDQSGTVDVSKLKKIG